MISKIGTNVTDAQTAVGSEATAEFEGGLVENADLLLTQSGMSEI